MSKLIIDSSTYKIAKDIAAQYASIQEKLEYVSRSSASDTTLKWVTLMVTFVSVLIGLRIFYLTRSKEFTVKRGDICGEIFKCFFDYKVAVRSLAENQLYSEANTKFIELLLQEEYVELNYTQYGEDAPEVLTYQNGLGDSNKRVQEQKDKVREIRRDLSKYFGQYKFYISKGEKDNFIKCVEHFNRFKFVKYDFTNCKSENEVKEKLSEYRKEFPELVRKIYKPGIDAVEAHLEKYN